MLQITNMRFYKAYGLSIRSSLALPELQTAVETSEPDVVIRFGKVNWELPDTLNSWRYFHQSSDSIYCYWNVVGKFQIRAGAEIIIDLNEAADENIVRLPLLGPVLALVLHQRSHFILHASAVVINGGGVLFMGPSGQGKSTTAATLYSQGHRLMTDDVSAVVLNGANDPMLLPGFPRIKLWPDAVNPATKADPNDLEPLHKDVKKLSCSTTEGFHQEPVPIKRIYRLAESTTDTPQIVSLPHKQAVENLLENAYVPMLFGTEFPHMLQQAQQFQNVIQCAALAQKVPVCRLERPYSLERLPELVALIESDFLAQPSERTPERGIATSIAV